MRKDVIAAFGVSLIFVFAVSLELLGQTGQKSAQPTTQNSNSNSAPQQAAPKSKRHRVIRRKHKLVNAKVNKNTNANSSNDSSASTTSNANTNSNSNASVSSKATVTEKTKPTASRKSVVTKAAKAAPEATASKKKPAEPRKARCNPEQHEKSDLSGTYTGTVNYPEGAMTGNATLTISGNQFTLSSDNHAFGGRITAIKTCSYTAVTMMFGEPHVPAPGERPSPPLPTVSLHAVQAKGGLTLKSVDAETRKFSFESKPSK